MKKMIIVVLMAGVSIGFAQKKTTNGTIFLDHPASVDESYAHCYPDHCNCDDGDCRPANPFWEKR